MELLDIMLRRRSIRKYREKEIPEDQLNRILEAALLAPTSRNRKPCEFYVVRDRDVLKKLSRAKASGAEMLAECGAAVVVCGDSEKADTWVEDCSIALTYMDLMAASLGLGSCWCQMHLRFSSDGNDAEENVRRILSVPASYRVVGILSLGIPEKSC